MTKTEIIRQALLRAKAEGRPFPSVRHLAQIAGTTYGTAANLKKRLVQRNFVFLKMGPKKPKPKRFVPRIRSRLPVGITVDQHIADQKRLFDAKAAGWPPPPEDLPPLIPCPRPHQWCLA